ncbi:MAG TPA: AAA family ATPase [Lachnospiraceae bacterium]|nr:AAA family ATPase [Lachnospiraceae bacterium]
MDHILSKLLIYGSIPQDTILMQMGDICKNAREKTQTTDELIERCFQQVKRILIIATDYGFDENLWNNYLTFRLIMDENPFSLTCEKEGAKDGSVNYFAKNDFKAFRQLFHYDFTWLENELGINCFSHLLNYKAIGKPELMYNKNVSERVIELSRALTASEDENEFFDHLTGFYKDYGVGMFGINKAFRISGSVKGKVGFHAINNMEHVMLDDLIGYEIQKKKLTDNTQAFVEGRKANNCLLFGDSGTGKSSCIKAIVNEFYPQGLRMIEIYKHQFKDLSNIIAQIKNRNYKFIIYMDDLSFEEFEIEYKFLKAVIEGGVETKPENVLIYATSNRRHLIKENWSDRDDMESGNGMHRSDTMEEKLSLVHRFGVTISFSKPSQKEYFEIVRGLAERNGINIPEEKLLSEANRWELSHGGISGRTAQQFITYLLGSFSE